MKYNNTERVGQTELDRKAIFDLYCISSKGERFIVEMQKAKQNYFKDRSLFYASFPIQEQAQTGVPKAFGRNYQLSPIYTVGILDFSFSDDEFSDNIDSNKLEVRREVQLKNQNGNVFYD